MRGPSLFTQTMTSTYAHLGRDRFDDDLDNEARPAADNAAKSTAFSVLGVNSILLQDTSQLQGVCYLTFAE